MSDEAEIARLNTRVALLERQVDALMNHLNYRYVDVSPNQLYPDVAEAKRNGNLIEAIKLYRNHTNAGLLEAKQFVENMPI